MVLIYCTTYYHLFNAIQLKLTKLFDEKVDLVLSADTDFKDLEKSLRDSGLFNTIVLSDISNVLWCREFAELKERKREQWFLKKVEEGHGLPIAEKYEHLYIGLDDAYNKFLYYCISQSFGESIPLVHIYEEGTASYVTSVSERLKNDGIPHNHFGNKSFKVAVCEILLYAPELRIIRDSYQVNTIPKIDKNDQNIKNIFNKIFYYTRFIEEKYIYFESGSFRDLKATMDTDILEMIANIVGKENIVVKLHPRTKNDRFTRRGYKVMPKESVPWEIYMLNEDFENKVFISNSSTTALTAKTIFDISVPIINLFKLDLLEETLYTRQNSFPAVYGMQEKIFNESRKCFFAPENEKELGRIINYLERENFL